MAAVTRAEIRAELRAALSDFPSDSAALAEEVTAAATVFKFAAADITKFKDGYDVEVEDEVCRVVEVKAVDPDYEVTVLRGHMGSAAVAHAVSKVVWCHNLFSDFDLNRLLNRAIASTWPSIWIEREDEESQVTDGSHEYVLAHTDVISVFIETGVGSGRFRPVRNCYVRSYVATSEADQSLSRLSAITFNAVPPTGLKIRYGYIEAVNALATDIAKLEEEVIYPALVEYIISRAASYAAAALRGRRQRFHEYSVAVADRVADVDQIIRSEFAYRNAADVVMADMKRPYPPVWRTRMPR